MGFLTENLSFEIGTSQIRIVKNGKLVVQNPTLIEVDSQKKLVGFGNNISGKVGLTTSCPMKAGVIYDFDLFEKLLRASIKSISYKKNRILVPAISSLIVIPDDISEVEIRGFRDSLEHVGSREVLMVYSTYCTAIGLGLKEETNAIMIIDAGSGKIGVSFWFKNNKENCIKIDLGADKLKELIINKTRELYDVKLSKEQSEDILHNYLNVNNNTKIGTKTIYARNNSGNETKIQLEFDLLNKIIEPYFKVMDIEIQMNMNNFLLNHKTNVKNILILGGLSKISGFSNRISELTGLSVIDKTDRNYTLEGLKILDSESERKDLKKGKHDGLTKPIKNTGSYTSGATLWT